MPRQIQRIGDYGRNNGARDHRRNQRRILGLVDNPVRKAEQRGNGSERQSGGHQEGRIHRPLFGAENSLVTGYTPTIFVPILTARKNRNAASAATSAGIETNEPARMK